MLPYLFFYFLAAKISLLRRGYSFGEQGDLRLLGSISVLRFKLQAGWR